MKTLIILIPLLLLLTSCGSSKSSGSGPESNTNPITGNELTPEEKALKNSLLEKGELTQKQLTLGFMGFKELTQNTLTKLDKHINVQCNQSSGLCYVTQKD
jgi:hypothetical protein